MAVLQFPRTLPTRRTTSVLSPIPIRLLTAPGVKDEAAAAAEPIWGIPSRNSLLERLRTLGELAPGAQLSFLAVEVGGLYVVNVQTPESALGTLIHAVATEVRRLTRATDMMGRLSPSGFGVILQGVGVTAAGGVAARLSSHLNALAAGWPGAEVRVAAATGTGVNALVLPAAAQDSTGDCC